MTKTVKRTTKPVAKKAAKVRLSGFGARDGVHVLHIPNLGVPWDKPGLGKTLSTIEAPSGLELDSEYQPRTFNKVVESIGVSEFLFLFMMLFLVGLMSREISDLARLLT